MMMSYQYDRMRINDTLFKNVASSFFASSPVVKQLSVFALRQTGFGEERQTDVHAKRASRYNAR